MLHECAGIILPWKFTRENISFHHFVTNFPFSLRIFGTMHNRVVCSLTLMA